ncbi:ribonuclease inhibitor-like [Mobula birostris]|uniref:ribonuclease inhibitor-like n=1 Tax=Mobula birostris TaxID=1983395 RepID=UPI003B28B260
MAFRGVLEKKIVFTDGDLINYNLQPSQFLSGFLMELLEREDSARLGRNKLGDSGVKLVSAALRNPECKIQKLWLDSIGLTDSGAEDLISTLSTNPSLTDLDLSGNKLGDSGVKLVSAALRNPECKIQKLGGREVKNGKDSNGNRKKKMAILKHLSKYQYLLK